VRLLVTLDLPEMVRRQAEAWQQEALTDPALRHRQQLLSTLTCVAGEDGNGD
jgi:hypothetical protein